MARVLEVYPGKNGIVRSALIKTVDGNLKRPVVKLAPLFERVGASNYVWKKEEKICRFG